MQSYRRVGAVVAPVIAVGAPSSGVKSGLLVSHGSCMMSGVAWALRAWTVVSLVLPLVSATMTWMMLMYVDDPSGVQPGQDLVQAYSGNRPGCHEWCPRMSALDGQVDNPVFLVLDMAGRMLLVTAAGACLESCLGS